MRQCVFIICENSAYDKLRESVQLQCKRDERYYEKGTGKKELFKFRTQCQFCFLPSSIRKRLPSSLFIKKNTVYWR